jgi:peptide/nickel transport system permease protein
VRGIWKFFRSLWSRWPGRISIVILIAICLIAIFAEQIAPYDPYNIEQRDVIRAPPSLKHPFGTDGRGIDLFSQIIYGSRVSLIVGFISALAVSMIGLILGVLAGTSSKIVDDLIMRIVDIFLVLPGLPIMIVLVLYLGGSFWNIILVFALLGWASVSRIVRSQTLSAKENTYVEVARAMGAGQLYIIRRHIIPNVMPIVAINAVMLAAGAILAEAGISYLGLGDATLISWGKILMWAQSGQAMFLGVWWWIVFPGVILVITVGGFLMLGYSLDEILNPRLRK